MAQKTLINKSKINPLPKSLIGILELDHLRGFIRTIPSFLMAYGNEKTTLANFEENIPDLIFKELTNITKKEFQQLRDGFEYEEAGEKKSFEGIFNCDVFNAFIVLRFVYEFGTLYYRSGSPVV